MNEQCRSFTIYTKGNNMPITTQQAQNALGITVLYDIYFNRLPDAEGLAWWMNDMENGATLRQVAQNMAIGGNVPQFGYTSTDTVIDLFYNNLVNHNADPEVHNHWKILAINAVPSNELAYQMTLETIGLPKDSWAGNLYLV